MRFSRGQSYNSNDASMIVRPVVKESISEDRSDSERDNSQVD